MRKKIAKKDNKKSSFASANNKVTDSKKNKGQNTTKIFYYSCKKKDHFTSDYTEKIKNQLQFWQPPY